MLSSPSLSRHIPGLGWVATPSSLVRNFLFRWSFAPYYSFWVRREWLLLVGFSGRLPTADSNMQKVILLVKLFLCAHSDLNRELSS